jgi:O-antigen/teichoic acid export membrane protein
LAGESTASPSAAAADVQSFATVGRGTLIMVVGTIVLFAASFVSRVLIAQGYSLADWGEFNLALALTGFLTAISLIGLDQAAARSLAFESDPAIRRSIVRYGVLVAVAAASVTSILLFLLAGPLATLFHSTALEPVFQIFSITAGFGLLGLMLAALFQGCQDAAPNAVFNQMVNPLLFVVFVVLALVFHWGFLGVMLGYVAAGGIALATLIGYALLRLPGKVPAVTGRLPPTPRLWNLAISFWGVGSLAFATAFIDTLILGFYRPAADVGIYSAAMLLARVLLVGNGALTYIYLPVAARLARNGDMAGLRATYLAGTRWSLMLVTPVMLVLALLPGESLRALFGSVFVDGAIPLQILAVGAFLSVIAGPANACQAGLGETRSLLGITAISASANVILSLGLTPVYGAIGGAIAWGVARALYPGIGLAVLHRRHGITIVHPSLLRPLALTLGVCVPVFLVVGALSPPAWIVFPLGLGATVVSVASLVATRSVLPGDFAILHGLESILRRPLPRVRRMLQNSVTPSASGLATGGT